MNRFALLSLPEKPRITLYEKCQSNKGKVETLLESLRDNEPKLTLQILVK